MKHPREKALAVANEMVAALQTSCLKIEIAGSLRRQKQLVKDAEILFCPITKTRAANLFEQEAYSLAGEVIERMLKDGILTKRLNANGHQTWGPVNKFAIHKASGINVDLFCEPNLDDWIRSLIIRTGSAEFNPRFIMACADKGVKVHAYNSPGFERGGVAIPIETEREAFALAGWGYIAPEHRI